MPFDYKVWRMIVIVGIAVNILSLFGVLDLSMQIFNSIYLRHLIAILDIFILWIILKRF